MTESRITEIREELDEYKENRSKAKGRIEDIETKWKDDFDVKDLKGAEELAASLEVKEKKLTEKEESLSTEIEELLDEMES